MGWATVETSLGQAGQYWPLSGLSSRVRDRTRQPLSPDGEPYTLSGVGEEAREGA